MVARGFALWLSFSLLVEPPVATSTSTSEPTKPPAPMLVAPPPPQPVEVDPRNYRMVLAGNIVIGLAGVGLITMIAGLGIRSDAITQRSALGSSSDPDPEDIAHQDQRIETGVALSITGGAAAAVLFTTGITLVALGYSRERKRRESLAWLPSPRLGRNELGLGWAIQF